MTPLECRAVSERDNTIGVIQWAAMRGATDGERIGLIIPPTSRLTTCPTWIAFSRLAFRASSQTQKCRFNLFQAS